MARKVRAITSFRANLSAFDKASPADSYYKHKYLLVNDNGDPESETEYQQNGREKTKINYTYDEKGQLIEKKVTYLQDEGFDRTVYTYDEEGHVVKEELYYDENIYETTVNEYNAEGKLSSAARYDEDNNLLEKDEYEYADGKLKRQLHYDEEDDPSWTLTLEYNENGLCTTEIKDTPGEAAKEYTHYTYNEHGKKVRSEAKDEKGNLIGFVEVDYDGEDRPVRYYSETSGFSPSKMVNQLVYDEEGRVIENEYYDVLHGYLVARETISYNEEGNPLEEEIFELNASQGSKTHFRTQLAYEYADEREETEA